MAENDTCPGKNRVCVGKNGRKLHEPRDFAET